jgi:hypothetical protein
MCILAFIFILFMKTSLVLSTAIAYRRCVNVQIFQHIGFWAIHFTQIYIFCALIMFHTLQPEDLSCLQYLLGVAM